MSRGGGRAPGPHGLASSRRGYRSTRSVVRRSVDSSAGRPRQAPEVAPAVPARRRALHARPASAAALWVALLPAQPAAAVDLIGLYVGGAVGQARVEADGASVSPTSFRETRGAHRVMAGIRPISLLGVEVA